MILHTVLFWLKAEMSPAERQTFEQALNDLPTIGRPVFSFVGRPLAQASHPVIDASYDHKLVLGFSDHAELAAYDSSGLHQSFIKRFAPGWAKVLVYDAAP